VNGSKRKPTRGRHSNPAPGKEKPEDLTEKTQTPETKKIENKYPTSIQNSTWEKEELQSLSYIGGTEGDFSGKKKENDRRGALNV